VCGESRGSSVVGTARRAVRAAFSGATPAYSELADRGSATRSNSENPNVTDYSTNSGVPSCCGSQTRGPQIKTPLPPAARQTDGGWVKLAPVST